MNSEFDQIREKIAEYEILRQEGMGKADITEQVEKIKDNLEDQLILEFLRVNEVILRATDERKWDKQTDLRKIFNDVIPEKSGHFFMLSMALRDCIDVWDLFWPEKGSLTDQLTPDSIAQFIKILQRRQEDQNFHSSLNFLFIPPTSRNDIHHMFDAIEREFGFRYKLAGLDSLYNFEPMNRPDFAYPLCFSHDSRKLLENKELDRFVKQEMPRNFMNGLTLPEYLLKTTNLSQRVDGSWKCANSALIDDRDSRIDGLNYLRVTKIDENSAIIGSKADEPKPEDITICLNGWE